MFDLVCVVFITELSTCFILITGFAVIMDKLMHESIIKKTCMKMFLSRWNGNPVLPDGLVYEGVSETPLQVSYL